MFQQQRYTAACGPAANLPRLCVLSPRLNCFAGAASRACEVDQFTKVITGWVPDMDSNSNSRVGSVGQNSRLISGRIAPCRLSLSCPKDHFPGRSGSNLDLVAHPAKLPFTYRAQRVHRPPQSESLLLVGPFKKRLFDKRPQSNWKHCRDDPSDPMLHHRKHRTKREKSVFVDTSRVCAVQRFSPTPITAGWIVATLIFYLRPRPCALVTSL
jgi:hypothetical protein